MPQWLHWTVSSSEAARRLGDVQGNIVTGHGRPHAAHVFLRFSADRGNEIREFISRYSAEHMPSCSEEISGRSAGRPFVGFHLSACGYAALGYEPPRSRPFRMGMRTRHLSDPPPDVWDYAFRSSPDAMVLVAADSAARLQEEVERLRPLAELSTLHHVEIGAELPGGTEHFGFVEGISQPLFLDEEVSGSGTGRGGEAVRWSPATPLRVVLTRDPYGQHEDSYGSYLVFRKLEQDVAAFDEGLRSVAKHLDIDESLAGALVVGRFKDGTPVSLHDAPGIGPVNDFDFADDGDGRRCPFASHIRKVNPRGQFDRIAEAPDLETRIARRAIPYGAVGDPSVGLLFLCFQSDIANQFELIQSNWCNFPDFGLLGTGIDPVAGQRIAWDHGAGQRWPVPGSDENAVLDFPSCVRMRGGEYFFTPSLSFLRGLTAK